MKASLSWVGMFLLVAAVGCGPIPNSALHKASRQLKPEMTRTNVEALFSEFPHSKPAAFEGGIPDHVVEDPTIIYQTNVTRGTVLSYSGGKYTIIPRFELCAIYFDTNDVIAGYGYSYDR
jgi:hypothetical protein